MARTQTCSERPIEIPIEVGTRFWFINSSSNFIETIMGDDNNIENCVICSKELVVKKDDVLYKEIIGKMAYVYPILIKFKRSIKALPVKYHHFLHDSFKLTTLQWRKVMAGDILDEVKKIIRLEIEVKKIKE